MLLPPVSHRHPAPERALGFADPNPHSEDWEAEKSRPGDKQ